MLNLFDSPMGPISEKNRVSEREAESETERERGNMSGNLETQHCVHVLVCVTVRHPCFHPSGRLRFFVQQQDTSICCKDPNRNPKIKKDQKGSNNSKAKLRSPRLFLIGQHLKTCKNKSLT